MTEQVRFGGPPGPARQSSKRRSSATDPIVDLGYVIRGPIAAGAFSKILRAEHVETRRKGGWKGAIDPA